METTQAIDEGLTFEKVWAAIQATNEQIKATDKLHALKKGFYVIEPSGDTFSIIEPKGIYHPHEW